MALELAIQKTRLRELLQSMCEEGIIDNQFCQLQTFKESMGPEFVVRSVTSYCVFVQGLFVDLTNHISQVNVNFYAVNIAARNLYEKTDSIGAVHVKLASAELLRASELLTGSILDQKRVLKAAKKISDACAGLLQEYVQSLLDETLKSADEPDAIIRLITLYFADVEAVLSELTRSLDSPEADSNQQAVQANTVKEKSLCIGAEHMKLACDNFIRACEEKQGRKLSQALRWLKAEFARTRDKLDAVVQMEKRILRIESKKHN